jgi:hypothetical protein
MGLALPISQPYRLITLAEIEQITAPNSDICSWIA